jgi:hypothetical protein
MANNPIFDDVPAWPDQAGTAPPMGHNRPPLDEEAAATYREELLKDRPDFMQRVADMEAAVERVEVTDDTTASRAGDFIKMTRQAVQHAEKAHATAKKPYLDAGRAVDSAKNDIVARLDKIRTAIQPKLNTFVAQREAEARARREAEAAEARRQADEARAAEELRREASDANDAEAMEQVPVMATPVAAAARPEPLRSDAGTTVSGRKVWQSEVTDYAAAFANVSDNQKVREAIDKACASLVKAGKRELEGVRIWEETQAGVR